MQIKTIFQEAIAESDEVVTIAVITNVTSHCILARQLMDVLGKPPVHSDLEILGSDDTWTIAWSQPQLTVDAATAAIQRALSPTMQENSTR
ncbi:hypothetical protein [Vacuolonema iberomarrocanum]|uniref:hypothetical protein n=1 Tax=Vacuolonema iberomarrocanum TaxID=3454632 RepID=UPI001A0F252A|nr:hypothetical protein [filamentous cyanobacterium LEGE 07170]